MKRLTMIGMLLLCFLCKEKESKVSDLQEKKESMVLLETFNPILKGGKRKGTFTIPLNKETNLHLEEVRKFSKAKDYKKALVEIEKILNTHYNSELFYEYAEILFQLNNLSDSLIAFNLSRKHGQRFKPELNFFRLSCIYSLQKKLPESLDYLERAIDRGFNDKELIDNEVSLQNLREDKQWRSNKSKLLSKMMNFSNSDLIGILQYYGPSWGSITYLCPNGKAYDMETCKEGKELLTGEWKVENNNLQFRWKTLCTGIGKGKPNFTGECGRGYEEYEFRGCKEHLLSGTISRSDLAIAFGRHYKGMEEGEEEFGYKIRPFKTLPKQCSYGFIPASVEDIDIAKHSNQ